MDLFYDYQNNLKSYPKWQQWLRDAKPPLLVIWERYDPRVEVHILDAGHSALDLKPHEVIGLIQLFMHSQQLAERQSVR